MWLFRLRRMFRLAGKDALVLFFAIRDPRTPRGLKIAATAALAWILSPIDPLPDLPLIGWVDDLLVLSVGLPLLISRLPAPVRDSARERSDRFVAAWWPGRKPPASGQTPTPPEVIDPPTRARRATARGNGPRTAARRAGAVDVPSVDVAPRDASTRRPKARRRAA